ncbi:hypothetical protein [Rhodopila sp.]|uniref:hypothetical protein n=1 Tax=Rhodopila sp. TaxID=2480087 RepID=UPI003D0FF278
MTDIKTASWFTKMPEGHVKVGISRGIPRTVAAGYRVYRTLAPGPWFHSVTPEEYDRLYKVDVLDRLDPRVVATQLIDLARGGIPVMVCYERPMVQGDWCHRAMAALWLAEALDRPIPELGFEVLAQADHPLMPPELKRPTKAGEVPDLARFVGRSATIDGEAHQVIAVDPNDPRRAIVKAGNRSFPAGIDTLTRHFKPV